MSLNVVEEEGSVVLAEILEVLFPTGYRLSKGLMWSIKRKRIGKLEVGLMICKNHKGAQLVMTNRKTMHSRIKKITDKSSRSMGQCVQRSLANSFKKVHTLTFEKYKAFAYHLSLVKILGVKTYFTRLYRSQDKGTVESRIGQLQIFFPKNRSTISNPWEGETSRTFTKPQTRKKIKL